MFAVNTAGMQFFDPDRIGDLGLAARSAVCAAVEDIARPWAERYRVAAPVPTIIRCS
jgi:hypothetical protein